MSQKHQKAYQPLPTAAMDNPAMSHSSSGNGSNDDVAGLGTLGLPATYSSQQLVSSDSDSMEENAQLQGRANAGEAAEVPRMSRRSQWFTVTVLCFVNLINYMDRFTVAGVLGEIRKDFELSDDKAGLLQTVFVISYMVCAPIFGYVGDRHSRPWIMAIGVALWSTTTLIGSFMPSFTGFIIFRALVGIGEASYSTIAPTIISDMFVHDMRSKMLALFYFAIPVGSGLGYIVGAKTASIANDWRWALRVTPILGVVAVLLILLIKDPPRGQSEGTLGNLHATTYKEDIIDLLRNRSFMLSTAGFTCVAFVAGALSWWGPEFMHLGMSMQPGNENLKGDDIAYKFGLVAMFAGVIGVPLGSILAQRLRQRFERCDPYICAAGLIISAPMIFLSLILPRVSVTLCFLFVFIAQVSLNLCWSIVADILLFGIITMLAGLIGVPLGSILSQKLKKRNPSADPTICAFGLLLAAPLLTGAMLTVNLNSLATYVLIFFGQLALNLNWAIVADILLYVVIPTRRSTAEAFQILFSHALGDAGSPYLVGVISEWVKNYLRQSEGSRAILEKGFESLSQTLNSTIAEEFDKTISDDPDFIRFHGLQYSLFSTTFIEVLGGIFFLLTACFIVKDRYRATRTTQELSLPLPRGQNVA